MLDEKEAGEQQKQWYDDRYAIITRLDQLIMHELSKDAEAINPELISKLAPARIAFFNEIIMLSDRSQLADVQSAYALGTSAVGGNA